MCGSAHVGKKETLRHLCCKHVDCQMFLHFVEGRIKKPSWLFFVANVAFCPGCDCIYTRTISLTDRASLVGEYEARKERKRQMETERLRCRQSQVKRWMRSKQNKERTDDSMPKTFRKASVWQSKTECVTLLYSHLTGDFLKNGQI